MQTKKIFSAAHAVFEGFVTAISFLLAYSLWHQLQLGTIQNSGDPDQFKGILVAEFGMYFFAVLGLIALLFFARSVRKFRSGT